MSDWPKRYECLDLDEDLDYNTPDRWIQCVSLEDFESLLNQASIRIYYSGNHQANSVEEVKQNLLQFLKEVEKNG
jgi:hypothetical protein